MTPSTGALHGPDSARARRCGPGGPAGIVTGDPVVEPLRHAIIRARDAERRKIQQDLHDGVQQELVALVAKLSLVRSSLTHDPARELINEVSVAALRIIDDLRELAHGSYPSVLSDLGLVAAVETKARRIPIPESVTSSNDLRGSRLSVEFEESAYFFVAESMANVLKHAQATRVAINLAMSDRAIEIHVQDNGAGPPSSVHSGSGLTALRDRIQAVNGSITVAEATAGGAIVRARIPLPHSDSPVIKVRNRPRPTIMAQPDIA